jgi:hypothetical protein
MEDCNPTQVPMEPRLKLSKRSKHPRLMQQSIGVWSEVCGISLTQGRTWPIPLAL